LHTLSAAAEYVTTVKADHKATAERLQAGQSRRRLSYDNLKRSSFNRNSLPCREKLELITPASQYLDFRVPKSPFSEELAGLRSEVHNFVQEWKTSSDTSMNGLCYIFDDMEARVRGDGRLADPRDDWTKEVKLMLKETKYKVQSLCRRVDKHIRAMMDCENNRMSAWARSKLHLCDAGVQADIPPPEDPRIASLEKHVEQLQGRLRALQEEQRQQAASFEGSKVAAEQNLLLIEQKLFTLHDSAYAAMHACYRHRYHWTSRCPNHFKEVDRTAVFGNANDVKSSVRPGADGRFATANYCRKLAEAADSDAQLLQKFSEYFVSDELFGVDFTGTRAVSTDATSAAAAATTPASSVAFGSTIGKKPKSLKAAVMDASEGLKENQGSPRFSALSPLQKNSIGSPMAFKRPSASEARRDPSVTAPECDRDGRSDEVETVLSAFVAFDGLDRQSPTDSAPLGSREDVPPPPKRRPSGLERMLTWQSKQHDKWKERRASVTASTPTSSLLIRFDDSPADEDLPLHASTPPTGFLSVQQRSVPGLLRNPPTIPSSGRPSVSASFRRHR